VKRLMTWLLSPFAKKRPGGWDAYHPGERKIYSYFDGQGTVKADPMVLWKKYRGMKADIDSNYDLANAGPKLASDPNLKGEAYEKITRDLREKARKGHDRYIELVRELFGVKTLAEGGLTDGEADDLIDHFLWYVFELKKNTPRTATTATGSSPTSPPPTSGAENPPTKPTSDSGSTGTDEGTGPPAPSSTAPDTPTGGPAPPSTSGSP
jgi:hypothetical protein